MFGVIVKKWLFYARSNCLHFPRVKNIKNEWFFFLNYKNFYFYWN